MKLNRFINLTSILLLSACSLQCNSTKTSTRQPLPPPEAGNPQPVNDQFSAALERAQQSAGADGLTKAFEVSAQVSLPGGRIKNLNQLRVSRDGTISIVDYERKQAESYDGSGAYLRPIGGAGNEPGLYVWPSDITETEDQKIAVSDFQGYRVNIFSKEGKFVSSFINTPQNFSANRLLYDDETRSYYLFGNRWQKADDGKITGAELVHKYSDGGDFINSYLPFPERAKALDLYTYDYPAADVAGGDLFVALPFDYSVYRLTPDGRLSTYLTGTDAAFKAPATGLISEKLTPAESYRYVQNWRLTWTPIGSLIVLGDKLLVQYQTFDPLRYTVDVWSLATKKKLDTVKTNHAILTRGADGYVYFLKNLEAKGQGRYDILRAKLRAA